MFSKVGKFQSMKCGSLKNVKSMLVTSLEVIGIKGGGVCAQMVEAKDRAKVLKNSQSVSKVNIFLIFEKYLNIKIFKFV